MHDTAGMPKMPKRATVEEAHNGFIVRCMDEKGNEKQMVCKDMGEVHKAMDDAMAKKEKKLRYKA